MQALIAIDLVKFDLRELAKYRTEAGLSIPALANVSGVTRQTLAVWEKELVETISAKKLVAVARAVGVEWYDLVRVVDIPEGDDLDIQVIDSAS